MKKYFLYSINFYNIFSIIFSYLYQKQESGPIPITKLEGQGINTSDITKLEDAGYHTVQSVLKNSFYLGCLYYIKKIMYSKRNQ